MVWVITWDGDEVRSGEVGSDQNSAEHFRIQ